MKHITCIQKALNLISRSPCPLAHGYVDHQEAGGQTTEELGVRHALPGPSITGGFPWSLSPLNYI